jgi:hypothetical protein
MYTVNVLLSWGSNNVLCSFRGYLRFGWNQVALVSLDYVPVGWPACMHAFIRHIRSTAHTDGGIHTSKDVPQTVLALASEEGDV